RKDGVGLEDVADLLADAAHRDATDDDLALARRLEAGDERERRRFAAPGRSDHSAELADTDRDVEVAERRVRRTGRRKKAFGHAVAATPDVVEAFGDPDPAAAIQPIAEAIRKSADASFVVVANSDGIRYSHPNTELIGQRVSTDPTPALAGQAYVGIQQGTLG